MIKLYQDKDWLKNKYINEKLSQEKISRLCEVSQTIIGKWLKKSNIIIRSLSESHKGQIAWNKGIPTPENIKEKISQSLKGRIVSGETRKKLSKIHKGKKKKYIVWNKGKKCPQLGFEKGVKFSKEHRQNISKSMQGKRGGVNNPNWKGGREKFNHRIWNSNENHTWRSEIFKRDNFTCRICGNDDSDNLNAHHIMSVLKILQYYEIIDFGEALKCKKLWDINNGITLCKDCHKEIHKQRKQMNLVEVIG